MVVEVDAVSEGVHVQRHAGIPKTVIVLALVVVVMLPVGFRVVTSLYRRHRVASELRRDQWPAFEREFRAYASRAWVAAREAERERFD
jgi:hypothetical protein